MSAFFAYIAQEMQGDLCFEILLHCLERSI